MQVANWFDVEHPSDYEHIRFNDQVNPDYVLHSKDTEYSKECVVYGNRFKYTVFKPISGYYTYRECCAVQELECFTKNPSEQDNFLAVNLKKERQCLRDRKFMKQLNYQHDRVVEHVQKRKASTSFDVPHVLPRQRKLF